jgi:hypothetical protein
MTVHNHGTEEGEGLACPETRLPGGQLKGRCLMEENAMPDMLECEPLDCQHKAIELVIEHIKSRYETMPAYEVYVMSFVTIGKSWKATLSTTLPNSGIFVVEFYALENRLTLKVYAMVETLSKYPGRNNGV